MIETVEFTLEGDESVLVELADRIAIQLANSEPFCLWLLGPMGAGKTTFSRYLLRKLGLSHRIPVTSPTFSYLNEYVISDKLYMHMDLFRVDDDFDLSELGLDEETDTAGFLVEWPEKISTDSFLRPTHKLLISNHNTGESRKYSFLSIR